MSPENISNSMVGHLSSEADSSLASLLKAGSSLTILKKNHHFFLS